MTLWEHNETIKQILMSLLWRASWQLGILKIPLTVLTADCWERRRQELLLFISWISGLTEDILTDVTAFAVGVRGLLYSVLYILKQCNVSRIKEPTRQKLFLNSFNISNIIHIILTRLFIKLKSCRPRLDGRSVFSLPSPPPLDFLLWIFLNIYRRDALSCDIFCLLNPPWLLDWNESCSAVTWQ